MNPITTEDQTCWTCSVCKPAELFVLSPKSPTGRKRHCIMCATEDLKNKTIRAWAEPQLTGQPCHDCARVFPFECMDFDHVYGEKNYNVGDLMRLTNTTKRREETREEIALCEIVCSNCHRTRTRKRATEAREVRRLSEAA